MRKSIFKYDCAKYSIIDIEQFIQEKGYRTSIKNNRIIVESMEIFIYLPDIQELENDNKEVWKRAGVPVISWHPINALYSQRNRARESGDAQKIKEAEVAYNQWHKEAQKLYNELKRKFGIKGIKTLADVEEAIKKGEYPMSIKDLDYIESLRNASDKKPWQFWK